MSRDSELDPSEVRRLLILKWNEVRARNPRYSIRAFAKSIKVDHSYLSRVLNGKRELTPKKAAQVAARLLISQDGNAPAIDAKMRELSLKEHLVLVHWVSAAIQELTHTKFFNSDPGWISERLRISLSEAERVIATLLRLGFLFKLENGRLVDGVSYWYSDTYKEAPESKQANLEDMRELNRIAEKALETLSPELFSFSSVTVSIEKDKLPRARELIARFRKDLLALLGRRSSDPDEVYVAKVDFFPVSYPVRRKSVRSK